MRQVVVAVDAETREGGEAIHVLGKGFQLVVVQAEATQTGAAPMSIASGGGGKAGGHNKTSKWGVGKVYIMREGGNDERASWGREGSSEGVSEGGVREGKKGVGRGWGKEEEEGRKQRRM